MTACCSSDTGNLFFFHSRPRHETKVALFFNSFIYFLYFLYGPRLAPLTSPRLPLSVPLPADSTFRYIMLPFHEYLATKLLPPPPARLPPLHRTFPSVVVGFALFYCPPVPHLYNLSICRELHRMDILESWTLSSSE